MTVDEWKALQSRLVDAWEQFTHTLQQAADALAKIFDSLRKDEKEKAKHIPYFGSRHKRKDHYLCNKKMTYKIERKPKKNLPYQRRNY